jgi:tight adherence protein C
MTPDLVELGVLGGVFAGVAALTFLLIQRLAENRRLLRQRLDQPAAGRMSLDAPAEMIMGPLTSALAAQVPMSEEKKSELRKEIVAAGFYRQTALIEYAAVRAVFTLVPLILALIGALMVDREQMLTVVFLGVLGVMAGFSLPRLYLVIRAKLRARQIERALPVAVDMLVMCLSAGLNLMTSIQRVCRELRHSHPVLAQELDIICLQAELSSLPLALQQFAERVQVPEVRNLAMILLQSERLGTDTSAALFEYSNNLRINIRQRADAYANRTMFWILFPTLLCLWIPAVIILIGPAVLEFNEYRRTGLREQYRTAREELRGLSPVRTPAPPEP